jgi:hypothetical protein
MTTDTETTTNETASVTAPAPLILSADDVAALRSCEAISFHRRKDGSLIRAMLDTIGIDRTYTDRQQRLFPESRDTGHADRARLIRVTSSIYGYRDHDSDMSWTHHSDPQAVCSALISAAQHHALWTTIAFLIRPGDRLHLSWIANNSTDLLRQAELHQDYLHLVVVRGQRQMTFAVADEVSPPHFPVRMIRRYG